MTDYGHINTNKAHERSMQEVIINLCGKAESAAANMRAFAMKASRIHGCQDVLRRWKNDTKRA